MTMVEGLNERGIGRLPGLIGLEVLEAEEGRLATRLELRDELLAPNGYLHAATIVALADTSCGYGTFVGLPEGAEGFGLAAPSPVTSVTLDRMRKSPASVPGPTGSSRSTTPNRRPKSGTRSVTVEVLVGPTFSIRRK